MAAEIGVTAGGYHAWARRRAAGPGARRRSDAALSAVIGEIFDEHRGRYGSPRVHAELRRRGWHVGANRGARLMADAGLTGRCGRRALPRTTITDPAATPAPNRLNRDFRPDRPDRTWVTDITYLRTASGWCYLAAIIDCYSRKVVGWALDDHMRSSLCEAAFADALTRRRPGAELVHHSDRGCQYTSNSYQQLLRANHVDASMSRKGNCWDNAVAESFWATVKRELTDGVKWQSKTDLSSAVFEYIEVYYNRRRPHSSLDYATPDEYGTAYQSRCNAA